MKYSVHIEGKEIQLDEKIDCRVCLSSTILLGEFKETPRAGSKDMTPKLFPVNLEFTAYYLPSLSLYVTTWKLVDDDIQQHRSIMLPWQGGLPIQFHISAHLEEALRAGIRRVFSGQYKNGEYSNERTLFVPYEGLDELVRTEGEVVVLASQEPSPMQAAPIEPTEVHPTTEAQYRL